MVWTHSVTVPRKGQYKEKGPPWGGRLRSYRVKSTVKSYDPVGIDWDRCSVNTRSTVEVAGIVTDDPHGLDESQSTVLVVVVAEVSSPVIRGVFVKGSVGTDARSSLTPMTIVARARLLTLARSLKSSPAAVVTVHVALEEVVPQTWPEVGALMPADSRISGS